MNDGRRVVVTGIGVVAPNGIGREAFWDALAAGRSGIGPIRSFDASALPCRVAGEVRDFDPGRWMDRRRARRLARFTQFAVASARMAFDDAGLAPRAVDARLFGAILGVSTSAMDFIERQHKVFLRKGLRHMMPYGIVAATPQSATAEVVAELGLPGRVCTVATGCAAGLDAVGVGSELIRSGRLDTVLAGGSDAAITELIMAGLCALNIMTGNNERPEEASRPFDARRDGGVLSEAAGAVVLEERRRALARGARVYAEIVGYGEAGDAGGTDPGAGMARAMEAALSDAGLPAWAVGHVNAHAPSDRILDAVETRAIKQVFGESARRVPVTSIKGMVGNPFAGIGLLQVAAACLAFREGLLAPTINYRYPDPECDLDYVANRARRCDVERIMVNSHGFGGSNSTLILRRCEP